MRNLRELHGQDLARSILESYLAAPPPLLILSGPESVGKRAAAEAFIQQSLCEIGVGCGQCAPCRKILRGVHADVVIFPEGPVAIGETEKPAEFTVRWLQSHVLCYSPFDGLRRFVLFPRADLILHEAETALLKTLEEPPEHTRFLMLTPSLEVLKTTITSRGIIVPFRRLPDTVLHSLARGLDPEFFELLGGSLELAPLLASEFALTLREACRKALDHPLALLDLEAQLNQLERKGHAEEEQKFSGHECVSLAALFLIRELHAGSRNPSALRALFDFLGRWNREQSGEAPYALGRLFQELDRTLFRSEGEGLRADFSR